MGAFVGGRVGRLTLPDPVGTETEPLLTGGRTEAEPLLMGGGTAPDALLMGGGTAPDALLKGGDAERGSVAPASLNTSAPDSLPARPRAASYKQKNDVVLVECCSLAHQSQQAGQLMFTVLRFAVLAGCLIASWSLYPPSTPSLSAIADNHIAIVVPIRPAPLLQWFLLVRQRMPPPTRDLPQAAKRVSSCRLVCMCLLYQEQLSTGVSLNETKV